MAVERASPRIVTSLMRRLEDEAKRQQRSSPRFAGDAIEETLLNCAEKRAAIRAAIEETEAGSFVSEMAMNEWVSSWGTDS